jgi:hydrogenase maturation protein HypF
MHLEQAADPIDEVEPYPLRFETVILPRDHPTLGASDRGANSLTVVDWEPLVRALVEDRRRGVPASILSARFHEALVSCVLEVARRAFARRVVLSGGCFQNLRLAARARAALEKEDIAVHAPVQFPPNDGGLSLGQVWIVTERSKERGHVSRSSG